DSNLSLINTDADRFMKAATSTAGGGVLAGAYPAGVLTGTPAPASGSFVPLDIAPVTGTVRPLDGSAGDDLLGGDADRGLLVGDFGARGPGNGAGVLRPDETASGYSARDQALLSLVEDWSGGCHSLTDVHLQAWLFSAHTADDAGEVADPAL